MSSILTPEAAALYGALDSAAIADGQPLDAHLLRVLGRNANRILGRGHPLLTLAWSKYTTGDGNTLSGFGGFAIPSWIPIAPLPGIACPKMPGLTSGKVFVHSQLTNEGIVYLAVGTVARPFDPGHASIGSPNVIKVTGSGSWVTDSLAGIQLRPEYNEQVSLHVLGVPTATTGTIGGTASGTITSTFGDSLVTDNAAAFSLTPGNSWGETGHAIIFSDAGTGLQIMAPRWIVATTSADTLEIYPAMTSFETRIVIGRSYVIKKLPEWQLGAIALYASDRVFA